MRLLALRPLVVFAALAASLAFHLAPARAAAPSTFEGQTLFVGDFGNARVLRVTPDAQVTEYAVIPSPCQMVFDEAGNLFVAGGKGIWKIAPHSGEKVATLENGLVTVVTDQLTRAKALARDRDGNFWVTEYYLDPPAGAPAEFDSKGRQQLPPGTLKKVTPDGKITVIEKDLVFGYGLSVAPDGSMYLAHLGSNSVVRYLPDGTKQTVGKHRWTRNPYIAPDGTVLIMGSDEIARFLPDGTKEIVYNMKGDEFGSTHCIGLEIDRHGVLYSTDWIKRAGQKSEGLLFRYEGGKRTVFARVGYSPSWLAFWPPTPAKPAAKP